MAGGSELTNAAIFECVAQISRKRETMKEAGRLLVAIE
jgi:hypothetical protein